MATRNKNFQVGRKAIYKWSPDDSKYLVYDPDEIIRTFNSLIKPNLHIEKYEDKYDTRIKICNLFDSVIATAAATDMQKFINVIMAFRFTLIDTTTNDENLRVTIRSYKNCTELGQSKFLYDHEVITFNNTWYTLNTVTNRRLWKVCTTTYRYYNEWGTISEDQLAYTANDNLDKQDNMYLDMVSIIRPDKNKGKS